MAVEEKPLSRMNIVVVGNFNPSILHPSWFERHSILPVDEMLDLTSPPVKVNVPDLDATLEMPSNFLVEQGQAFLKFKSFRIIAKTDRFEAKTNQRDKFNLVLNVTQKVFMILAETPITAYGFNFLEHIKFTEDSSVLQKRIVEKQAIVDDVLGTENKLGFKLIVNRSGSQITFQVEPSSKLEGGFLFNINHHFDCDNATLLAKSINSNFSESIEYIETAISKLFGGIVERAEA